ncbi:MAG: DUF2723 domain-containing protein [Myxococcota bacterium]|nr:DUF2723 domain-containing protein [Myxococcota bacterium]
MYPGFGGRIHYGDSAEFHFLGVVDGVAHPSGYPLYLLICKLFVLLLGHIKSFEAVSYVSVVFGALTVGFIFLVAVQYSGSRIGALLVSALYGFSFTFWCQSTEAEVYTLQTFFVVAVTYFTILYYESGRAVYLLAGMFLFCMSFGAHLTMIFLAPSFVFLVIKKDRRLLKDVRVLAALFLFLVIGISQFGYLYYLSNLTPKPHLNTLPADASFIQVLKWAASGQYMGSIFFFKLQEMLIGRPKMLFGLLLDEFSIVGFILIVAGISASFMLRIKPAIVWFFVLHLTSHGIFAMGYRAPDSQVFFLPFSLSLVILSASLFVKRKSIIVQHTGRKSPAPSQEIGHNTPYPKSRLNLHLIFLFILAICMVVHRNTEIRGVSRTNNEVFAKIAAIVPHVPSGSAIYLGKKYINYHTGYGLNYLEKTKELGEHEFIRTRNIERNQLFVTNEGKKDLGNELFQFERQSGLRLDEFAKKYSNETILWVSQGPIGQNALVDRYFREVGSKIFAGRRKRSRYLGVVEKGRIRCERRNDQKTVAISHKDCAVLAKHCPKIYIEATRPGGMKKSYGNFPQGLRTKIEIDGEGWAVGLQGLNGLVLGENCRVIANVHFSIEPGSAESSDTVYCAERRNIVSN